MTTPAIFAGVVIGGGSSAARRRVDRRRETSARGRPSPTSRPRPRGGVGAASVVPPSGAPHVQPSPSPRPRPGRSCTPRPWPHGRRLQADRPAQSGAPDRQRNGKPAEHELREARRRELNNAACWNVVWNAGREVGRSIGRRRWQPPRRQRLLTRGTGHDRPNENRRSDYVQIGGGWMASEAETREQSGELGSGSGLGSGLLGRWSNGVGGGHPVVFRRLADDCTFDLSLSARIRCESRRFAMSREKTRPPVPAARLARARRCHTPKRRAPVQRMSDARISRPLRSLSSFVA